MTSRRIGRVRGVVQGVGFRPFVARLAADLAIAGCVRNTAGVVELDIEGPPEVLQLFDDRLARELPAPGRVEHIDWRDAEPAGARGFAIDASGAGETRLTIPPDLAVCDECLAEVSDPSARRHQYPFTSCTRCGPRFTIAEGAPFDRERTSMASFPLCERCAREYGDPDDRRFHAQAIGCSECGPIARLVSRDGSCVASGDDAIAAAAVALQRGQIVALKGLGGYQLLVRADDEEAVNRLRHRKRRPAKPLAVLVADLGAARAIAIVDELEAEALRHPAAPIVLLRRRNADVAAAVAPRMRALGIMLPATPMHALVAMRVRVPLVCTSGNLHDEPICIDDGDALERLGSVADAFLLHDRAILRRADDSVVHVVCGKMRALRVARGLAPASMSLAVARRPILALGGHLKQAPVFAAGGRAVLWPQVGDMHSPLARDAMVESLRDLESYLGAKAESLAIDAHPDYATTMWAEESGRATVSVQHHHAHVAAVLAEHGRDAALGFAWDGVGLGDDGTAWGGETLVVDRGGARRVARLRSFPLPGGDAAARDGRRPLAGLLSSAELSPPAAVDGAARFMEVAASPHLSPPTTSVGRLFDAVAAATGVAMQSRYEGEAAMALEAVAEPGARPYPFAVDGRDLDWRPMLAELMAERDDAVRVASRFHATLVQMIVEMCSAHGADVVALGGGCFCNRILLEQSVSALMERGCEVLIPERVPPGDGGLALGQAWVASCRGSSCA